MNERILKLAASCFPRDGDGNIHATPEIIAEFAELIVRECAKRVDYWESRQGEHADDLLKHFGVEE